MRCSRHESCGHYATLEQQFPSAQVGYGRSSRNALACHAHGHLDPLRARVDRLRLASSCAGDWYVQALMHQAAVEEHEESLDALAHPAALCKQYFATTP